MPFIIEKHRQANNIQQATRTITELNTKPNCNSLPLQQVDVRKLVVN